MTSNNHADHLMTIGAVIREARQRIKDDNTGRHISQAAFYKRCQKVENPDPGRRAGVSFPATHAHNQREIISEIERGVRKLTPGQRRIIEGILGWPSTVLDGNFRSIEDFHSRYRELECRSSAALQPLEPMRQSKKARQGRAVDLNGIRLLPDGWTGIQSRKPLASKILEGLLPTPSAGLKIVAVLGEAGIGKSQLIAEWWRSLGRTRFTRRVYSLDCARLGGDEIVRKVTDHFVDQPSPSAPGHRLTNLAKALAAKQNTLVVLDGLSIEGADPEHHLVVPTGRADKTAFREVCDMLVALGSNGARASFLLGIQTGAERPDAIGIEHRLNASADLATVFVARLNPEDGAQMMRDLGVEGLSMSDRKHLSARLQGLPILITAAAHYLRHALPEQVEAFLMNIDDREQNFRYFKEFLGRYLEALSREQFDSQAHPHAFLRLLALMPGPVPKQLLDALMSSTKIKRLETGQTAKFERMNIPFIVNRQEQIDINPIIRSLLRHELDRLPEQNDDAQPIRKSELRWIHASAANWYLGILPKDPSNFDKIKVRILEGALYHLLALRDYVGFGTPQQDEPVFGNQYAHLTGANANPDGITRFCLSEIVHRFLISKQNRATRILGLFETKARLLSLFLENLNEHGQPRHLRTEDQVTIYTEIGVCWMHCGRLQLAKMSLAQARERLRELGADTERFSPVPRLEDGKFDLWRAWTDTINTDALITMRLGRDCEIVDDILHGAIEIALRVAKDALKTSGEILPNMKAIWLAARRVICRYAHVRLNAGDLQVAIKHYDIAIALERKISQQMISGDALRRYIEAIIRRGPCLPGDLKFAEKLIDDQIGQKGAPVVHRRLSNDVISLFVTKAIILRAKGEFSEARSLLEKTAAHEFVIRGECSFASKAELDLECFRLEVACGLVTEEHRRSMDLFRSELLARHHLALYCDATIVLAEMVDEPRRSQLLYEAEMNLIIGKWYRRQTDIAIIREGRSAVMAMGC